MFRKDDKLYEVNDSHCSCHGLDHWFPEETFKEALLHRLDNAKHCLFEKYNEILRKEVEKL